jgi:hypothetical protein
LTCSLSILLKPGIYLMNSFQTSQMRLWIKLPHAGLRVMYFIWPRLSFQKL